MSIRTSEFVEKSPGRAAAELYMYLYLYFLYCIADAKFLKARGTYVRGNHVIGKRFVMRCNGYLRYLVGKNPLSDFSQGWTNKGSAKVRTTKIL